jgi:antitoxin VapB
MALNIKNREAERLAHDLAKLTGETLADTVTTALRERLERERVARERRGLAERLMAIGREFSSELTDEERALDMDVLLYDEGTGLPR